MRGTITHRWFLLVILVYNSYSVVVSYQLAVIKIVLKLTATNISNNMTFILLWYVWKWQEQKGSHHIKARKNCCQFADNIFEFIFLKKSCILIQITIKFISRGSVNQTAVTKQSLVLDQGLLLAWHKATICNDVGQVYRCICVSLRLDDLKILLIELICKCQIFNKNIVFEVWIKLYWLDCLNECLWSPDLILHICQNSSWLIHCKIGIHI